MEYKYFLKSLLSYKKLLEDFSDLYNMGFDFLEGKYKLESLSTSLITSTFESHYTEEGCDSIFWFVYENEFGQKDWGSKDENDNPLIGYGGMKDKDGNPLCFSFESTWEYVKQYEKKNI
jgi:hypothetical protein